MKNIIFAMLALFLTFTSISLAETKSVTGKWKTIDDDTGKPKSIVEIFKDGNEFKGKVLELINPDKPDPTCEKCEGDKKDKPVKGLEFLWGMEEKKPNEEWSGGHILDPKNGKTYKCRLRLKENGTRLEVRGYIGFSLLGRTQVWERQDN